MLARVQLFRDNRGNHFSLSKSVHQTLIRLLLHFTKNDFFSSIIFWDMTSCSLLSFNRRFGGTYRLHLQGRREAICSSETSAETQQTTRRHNPDDTLHNHHCQNLKSYRTSFNLSFGIMQAPGFLSVQLLSHFLSATVQIQ
jgi:hypothetical protein